MSHAAEEWTDRYGRQHTSCGECEEAWPCRESSVKSPGWLVPGFLDAKDVISTVAHGFGVSVDEVLSDSAKRHVQAARACAMAVVKQTTGWSYPTIGEFFGRHHTSVMDAVGRVNADPELSEAVRRVVAEMSHNSPEVPPTVRVESRAEKCPRTAQTAGGLEQDLIRRPHP